MKVEVMMKYFFRVASWTALLFLASCGGGSETLSSKSDITVGPSVAGPTPFIAFVRMSGTQLKDMAEVRFVVAPKAQAAASAVDVTYTAAALARSGYLSTASATLPVFGLYAGRTNDVDVIVTFVDDSRQRLTVNIAAPGYVDPTAVYDRPVLKKTLATPNPLGFNYFFVKSGSNGPVVIDVDGEVRWVAPFASNAFSSAFINGTFVVGAQNSNTFQRIGLDGTTSNAVIARPAYTAFHHNIDPGKIGWLGEFNAVDSNGVRAVESLVAEFDPSGAVLIEWDFAAILGDYMRSQGDDPSAFVRPGIDWFHVNAATYDPRDDSILASSRENFVIKIDYTSKRVLWIFGDPSKYWYRFPSLRAKALRLSAGGLYPVGQHATSITSSGHLMLFNNGAPSFNQPTGAPVGEFRNYSAVSTYVIDPAAMTAVEAWRFDFGQTIRSDICSSVYEARSGSLLISYAAVDNRTKARLVGLDALRNVVFDFEYASSQPCLSSWNAEPFLLEGLRLQ